MKNITSVKKNTSSENVSKSPKSRHSSRQNITEECKSSEQYLKVPLRDSNKPTKTKNSITLTSKVTPALRKSPADNYTNVNRKSVEESSTNQKSNCTPLNTSHPPLNRFLIPLGSNPNVGIKSIPKSISNLPSTPVTPKGLSKTSLHTPSERERGSSQKSISQLKKSVEGKSTPVSNLAVSNNTPLRKSVGSGNKKDARKSSSLRSSASKSLYSSSSNCRTATGSTYLTPSTLRQRSPAQGVVTESLSRNELDHKDDEFDVSSSRVSVGVRVRPISERELQTSDIYNIIFVNDNEVVVRCENGSIHTFSYDYCFDSSNQNNINYASQKSVYECIAKPLLSHVFEGYNVCLFAYGQTGSGKSYCIMGEECENRWLFDSVNFDDNEDSIGIIPRFCRDLFDEAQSIHSGNADREAQSRVVVEISYIEIYNEKIYDLIGSHNVAEIEDHQKLSTDKREALKVREHPQNGPYVIGASCHLVTSYQDLQTWIVLGNKQRSIAATGMNDKSSRSHSVFSVTVTQTETELIEGVEMEHSRVSKINLIDLAGSERAAGAKSEGDRLKEGVCINKSLLTLGKVITALAENTEKKTFIPYRESTLTWLLKESLGGNSKTSMIATISPCNIHQEESLSTLRYAQQAQKIVNWNRINEDSTSKIIRALKLEVERLRSMQMCYSPRNFLDDFNDDAEEGLESPEIHPLSELHSEEQRSKEREIIRLKEAEIKLLKEKLRSTQEQFSEKAKLLEVKVQEAEQSKREALERCRLRGLALKVEDHQPTLVNLCEDPQLSQTLLYSLKKGSTTLGTSNADVTLCGLHKSDVHCTILYEDEKLTLHPRLDTETYVNGKLVTQATQIFHNDRIVLAGTCFFRVCIPNGETRIVGKNENKFNYHFAKDELLKEQEDRIRYELDLQLAPAIEEMLREVDEHRQELKLQEMTMEKNLQSLNDELIEERFINQKTEVTKIMLEAEKEHLANQISSLKRLNSQSSDSSGSFSPNQEDSFFKNMEMILDESVQTVETKKPEIRRENVEAWFLVTEANSLCSKIKKSYHFQQQSVLKDHGFEYNVLVHDLDHNLCGWLDLTQLKRVITILRDITENEDDNHVLLETIIHWEREDKTSRLPIIQNKMRENIRRLSLNRTPNSSFGSCLNVSFNSNNYCGFASTLNGRKNSRRKSLLNQSFQKLIPPVYSRTSIAKATSRVILEEIATNDGCDSIFINIIKELFKLYDLLKKFISHFHNPPLSSEDNEVLNQEIVILAVAASNLNKSLKLLSLESMPNITGEASDIKINIKSFGSIFARKAARMLQGVEKEVETLIEEENAALINLIYEILEEIGFLNIASSQHLPDETLLISSLQFCKSYLLGISRGLEWNVVKTAEACHAALPYLSISAEDEGWKLLREEMVTYIRTAFKSIANLLDQFSQLKVIPHIDSTMPEKDVKKEVKSFLIRVSRASKNTEELISSFVNIRQDIQNISQGSNYSPSLIKSICKLRENLGELMDDAGLKKDSKVDSSSSSHSEETVLSELYALAHKAFKDLGKLESSIYKCCESELLYIKESDITTKNSMLKSCMKTNEEKKVRFDITPSLILTGSFLDDHDDDDTVDV